jgi:hypothetical protein
MTGKRGPSPKARKHPRKKPRSRRAARRDPLDDLIAVSARSLGLKIERAWLPAVRGHLQVILRHGALVSRFELPDDAEPAPVFRA